MSHSTPSRWLTVEALALREPLTGVGRYTSHLLAALLRRYPELGLDLCVLGRGDLDTSLLGVGESRIEQHRRSRVMPRTYRALLAARLAPPIELLFPRARRGVATFYPNFVRYPSLRRVPEAVVVHDATFRVSPEDKTRRFRHGWSRLTALALKSRARPVTVSRSARDDIERFFECRESLHVVYPGVGGGDQKVAVPPYFAEGGPYALVLGTASPRKNLDVVFQAHQLVVPEVRPRLVVVGFGHTELPGVDVLGWVSDEGLASIMAHASTLIAPSINEGFDLPVIEALAAGVPVLASDIPVHREVLGDDAAGWFAPHDARALAELIVRPRRQIKAPDLRRFDWDCSSAKLAQLLEL